MTNELFIGGLMILTLVAGIVIAMTSKHNSGESDYEEEYKPRKNRNPTDTNR
ncbi:hypothetical protein GGR95_000073 [Sulfitobacter undariae]|uniref:Uncharacterized protein n=1 Tax=Sulfitobacter undariae TaxID=1563671 RepID=A0A7W6E151_9RHOB|nr:hypothetical protein [Sulfitobacter undariae]MBB3992454.1 hypothetical protein [Sulfitobacter undariae]